MAPTRVYKWHPYTIGGMVLVIGHPHIDMV